MVLIANPLRQKLDRGEFCHMVELVASKRMPEENLLEVSVELAGLDTVVAAGITSYAGGALGQDWVRIAVGVKERGLTPNVHVTCVYQDRIEIRKTLEELNRIFWPPKSSVHNSVRLKKVSERWLDLPKK